MTARLGLDIPTESVCVALREASRTGRYPKWFLDWLSSGKPPNGPIPSCSHPGCSSYESVRYPAATPSAPDAGGGGRSR